MHVQTAAPAAPVGEGSVLAEIDERVAERSAWIAKWRQPVCCPSHRKAGWPSLTAVPVWDYISPRRATLFPPYI